MSTRTAVVIVCDYPGCDDEYVGSGHEEEDVAAAAAQGNHWGERSFVDDKGGITWIDLCPDHKEVDDDA